MADVITSNTLNNPTPLVVPTAKVDLTPYQSIVNGAITSLPDINTQVDNARSTQNSLVSLLSTKIADTSGKTQYLVDQQNINGVNTEQVNLDSLNARFNDLTASLKGLSNKSLAIPLEIQNKAVGQGQTDAGVAPLQSADLRNNAIQALTLSSEADAVASNITNSEARLQRAKDKAQQAVDLKYKPIEDQISQLQAQLDLNSKYILDPTEKKRQEASQITLDERKRLLDEQKTNDSQISQMFVNAVSASAPQTTINRAKAIKDKGGNPTDVAIALGAYSGDYYKTELLKQQINTEKAQRINYYTNIAKIKSEIAQNSSPVAGVYGVNPTKWSSTAQSNYTAIQGVIDAIKQWTDQINKNGGTVAGTGLGAFIPSKFSSQDAQNSRTASSAINLKTQQWASGASLTETQTQMVMNMVPSKYDSDGEVKRKLNSLNNFMATQVGTVAKSQGQNALIDNTVDLFGTGEGTKPIDWTKLNNSQTKAYSYVMGTINPQLNTFNVTSTSPTIANYLSGFKIK